MPRACTAARLRTAGSAKASPSATLNVCHANVFCLAGPPSLAALLRPSRSPRRRTRVRAGSSQGGMASARLRPRTTTRAKHAASIMVCSSAAQRMRHGSTVDASPSSLRLYSSRVVFVAHFVRRIHPLSTGFAVRIPRRRSNVCVGIARRAPHARRPTPTERAGTIMRDRKLSPLSTDPVVVGVLAVGRK